MRNESAYNDLILACKDEYFVVRYSVECSRVAEVRNINYVLEF